MSKGSRRAFASGRVLVLRDEESGAAFEACLPPCGDTTQLDRTTVNTTPRASPPLPASPHLRTLAQALGPRTPILKLNFSRQYNLQCAD